jgi:hypothetical protein
VFGENNDAGSRVGDEIVIQIVDRARIRKPQTQDGNVGVELELFKDKLPRD